MPSGGPSQAVDVAASLSARFYPRPMADGPCAHFGPNAAGTRRPSATSRPRRRPPVFSSRKAFRSRPGTVPSPRCSGTRPPRLHVVRSTLGARRAGPLSHGVRRTP